MNIVEIKNLSKAFNGRFSKKRLLAVDNVTLNIKRGEILGLLGINGAGKTTLLKMICGLLKPTSGEILILGKSLEKNRSHLLNHISAVLEGSRNALWSMTVKQNLAYFGHLKNIHGQVLATRSRDLLDFFQLDHKKNEVVRSLSKGMKQKLAIVLAFISDPDLILLDEPTLGLDIQTANLLKKRIVELADRKNKSVLLTTHQIEMVEEICDRVAIIHKGRLMAFEKTDVLLGNMGREQYVFKFEKQPDTTILEDLPGVKQVDIIPNADGDILIQLIIDKKDTLFRVLDIFQKNQTRILSISKSEPHLEDVFINMIEAKSPSGAISHTGQN